VDAYDPGARQWYNFDQVVITVMATPRHFRSTGTRPPATSATHTGCAGPAPTTPANVIQAYYRAVNRGAYACARSYLAPVAPDVYNVLFGPISGMAGRVTIVRLTPARYRIRTGRATYTCVGAQLLAHQRDHSAAAYGGWYLAQVSGRGGWHLVVQGTQMAPGGVLYIPTRALCAAGIPSSQSGVVRPSARGGTQSPAQAPAFVAAGQVRRGRIYDRNGVLLAGTVVNARGIFKRTYRDPSLVQTIGYDSDLYGKSGIEAAYDSYLAGRSSGSGWAELFNRSLQRPIVGDDVRLTIDERLQQAVASALPDWPSAAVVADPRSGEILALVSKPYYDPNQSRRASG
jgi:hypothetical protein